MNQKQRGQIEQIRASHADLETAYQLTQTFVTMLAEHRETGLDDWLTQAVHSGIKELKSFAEAHPSRLRCRARGVHFRMEQWAGGSPGQLPQTAKTADVRPR
jgi:hypothetical protein